MTLPVSVRTVVEAIAAAVLLGAFGVKSCQLEHARKDVGAAALQADTLRASLDSSRHVNLAIADTLDAVQRQTVQVVAARDAIDRQLGLERIATAQLTAQVKNLQIIVTGSAPVTETAEGERVGKFVVDSTPYHVAATVTLPRPPGAGRIALGVTLDPIHLETRQGCSDPNEFGIRSAFLTIVGPDWAQLSVDRTEQDPSLCRSPALEPVHNDGRAWWRKAIDRVGVSAGIGGTFGVDLTGKPSTAFGVSILAGVKIWP